MNNSTESSAVCFLADDGTECCEPAHELPSTADEWSPSALFRAGAPTLAGLFKILVGVREPQLGVPAGAEQRHLAEMLAMWVEGGPLGEIVERTSRG